MKIVNYLGGGSSNISLLDFFASACLNCIILLVPEILEEIFVFHVHLYQFLEFFLANYSFKSCSSLIFFLNGPSSISQFSALASILFWLIIQKIRLNSCWKLNIFLRDILSFFTNIVLLDLYFAFIINFVSPLINFATKKFYELGKPC